MGSSIQLRENFPSSPRCAKFIIFFCSCGGVNSIVICRISQYPVEILFVFESVSELHGRGPFLECPGSCPGPKSQFLMNDPPILKC